jgi:hypothetical protein
MPDNGGMAEDAGGTASQRTELCSACQMLQKSSLAHSRKSGLSADDSGVVMLKSANWLVLRLFEALHQPQRKPAEISCVSVIRL